MRTIIKKTTLATGQTATTSELRPGARGEGWRLWDGILRVFNSGADVVTVSVYSSVTGELIDSAAAVAAGAGKSSNTLKIPGAYYVVADAVGAGGAVIEVWLDGDTGKPPATVTVA